MNTRKNSIARLIREKGLTQDDVAKLIGVTRQAVQQWASGKTLRQENLSKLAEILNTSIDQLLAEDGVSVVPYRAPVDDIPEEGWVRVPVYAIEGSCHDGVCENQSNSLDVVRSIEFRESFLRSLPGVIGSRIFHIVTADGDSMEPTIPNRSLCIVDGSQSTIRRDGIFVLQASGQIFIKRVQRNLDATFTLLSDNSAYRPMRLDPTTMESVRVVGCVVYVFSGKEC